MLRRRTMTKAFLIGVQELEKQIGPEATDEWMRNIGEVLADFEGPGIMGEQEGDLNVFPICLFAPKLDEFLEECGDLEEHDELLKYVKVRDGGVTGPAAVNVCCSMCHAYRKKRGKLSGKKGMLHLAAKYKLTGKTNVNEEAVKKSGHKKQTITKLLDKYDCINKYI